MKPALTAGDLLKLGRFSLARVKGQPPSAPFYKALKMKNYVISYDLHHRRNYAELYKLLSAWNAQKLTESQWLVSLNCSAMAALNFVVRTVDNDDTVTVVEIPRGSDWATMRGPVAANAWLSRNVTPQKIAA